MCIFTTPVSVGSTLGLVAKINPAKFKGCDTFCVYQNVIEKPKRLPTSVTPSDGRSCMVLRVNNSRSDLITKGDFFDMSQNLYDRELLSNLVGQIHERNKTKGGGTRGGVDLPGVSMFTSGYYTCFNVRNTFADLMRVVELLPLVPADRRPEPEQLIAQLVAMQPVLLQMTLLLCFFNSNLVGTSTPIGYRYTSDDPQYMVFPAIENGKQGNLHFGPIDPKALVQRNHHILLGRPVDHLTMYPEHYYRLQLDQRVSLKIREMLPIDFALKSIHKEYENGDFAWELSNPDGSAQPDVWSPSTW